MTPSEMKAAQERLEALREEERRLETAITEQAFWDALKKWGEEVRIANGPFSREESGAWNVLQMARSELQTARSMNDPTYRPPWTLPPMTHAQS